VKLVLETCNRGRSKTFSLLTVPRDVSLILCFQRYRDAASGSLSDRLPKSMAIASSSSDPRIHSKDNCGNLPPKSVGLRDFGMHTEDRSSMTPRIHEFATRPALLRRALEFHQDWIERTLEVTLADVVIFQVDLNLAQIGVEKILACSSRPGATSRAVRRLRPVVASADMPPGFPPLVGLSSLSHMAALLAPLEGSQTGCRINLEWQDCPVAMRFHRITAPVIALNIHYHAGPSSDRESVANLLIVRRECADEVVRLVEDVDRRDSQPRLHVLGGRARRIVSCAWDELVLDQSVLTLLRDDFESFFERQNWFRENRLPFRRGYLLHGPPGNGKSTAIRAMMTSRGLTAHTLRLFDSNTDDASLDALFDHALTERPAMILLEDLDRAFPKTGETKSRVSLQQLLNCLDGVGTGEGIIVVATANEPTILDPAILRRPGRFDRLIHFADPNFGLRQAYFRRMHPAFETISMEELATESERFSFAQLREAFITAGQRAFERKDEIREEDLLSGIRSLRQSMMADATRSNATGFRAAPQIGVRI
jgi:ATPase family associated with various cellular activities (AAA)